MKKLEWILLAAILGFVAVYAWDNDPDGRRAAGIKALEEFSIKPLEYDTYVKAVKPHMPVRFGHGVITTDVGMWYPTAISSDISWESKK
jgi:hypothetical protein